MAPLYKLVTAELGVPVDEALLAKLSEANSEQVKKLTDALESAKTNAGETEVKDAILAHGDYFASIGDKDKATEWYEKAFEKSVGAGTKLDVIFSIIRVGFFWHDLALIKKNIERARKYVLFFFFFTSDCEHDSNILQTD